MKIQYNFINLNLILRNQGGSRNIFKCVSHNILEIYAMDFRNYSDKVLLERWSSIIQMPKIFFGDSKLKAFSVEDFNPYSTHFDDHDQLT